MKINTSSFDSRKLFLGAVALCFLISVLSFLFAEQFPIESDDLTLFNPVYMFLHSGKMSYPVHGWLSQTIVHPPVRYYSIALFMKLGMNSFYAFLIPLIIISLILVIVIIYSPFSNRVKFSFLAPLFLIYFFNCYSIRPDVTLALTWFCGMLLLESARQQNWHGKKLFLGSLLLTYASGLHYYASFAFLGIIVYMISAFREMPVNQAWRKTTLLAAGGALFGIPYLFFYIIPNWEEIRIAIDMNQVSGGIPEAIRKHLIIYRSMYGLRIINPDDFTGIPPSLRNTGVVFFSAILVSYALLLRNHSTKRILLASFPLTLVVLFFSTGKSPGYFLPEMLMVSAGFFLAFTALFKKIFSSFFSKRLKDSLFISGAGILLVLALMGAVIPANFKTRDLEMHLTRACTRAIIGDHALVGGRMGSWYISGGDVWYNISADLLVEHPLPADLKAYFSNFDALAETRHKSNFSLNPERLTLLRCYEAGLLKLKGFYLSDNMGPGSELATMLFQTEYPEHLVGFGSMGNNLLYRFDDDSLGDYLFLSFVLPKNEKNRIDHLEPLISKTLLVNYMGLVNVNGPLAQDYSYVKEEMIFMLLPLKAYLANKEVLPSDARIVDFVKGRLSEADRQKMLNRLAEQSIPIQFPISLPEAIKDKEKLYSETKERANPE